METAIRRVTAINKSINKAWENKILYKSGIRYYIKVNGKKYYATLNDVLKNRRTIFVK
jgi:hypothetical protein